MLTISRTSTEIITTSPEIPESLLGGVAPIATHDDEWSLELERELISKFDETLSRLATKLYISPCGIDRESSTQMLEIIRNIILVIERSVTRDILLIAPICSLVSRENREK
jgi:hypothetical protein